MTMTGKLTRAALSTTFAVLVAVTTAACSGADSSGADAPAGAVAGDGSAAQEPAPPAQSESSSASEPPADDGDGDPLSTDGWTISDFELEEQGQSSAFFLNARITNRGSENRGSNFTLIAYQGGQEVWRGIATTGGSFVDPGDFGLLGFQPDWPEEQLGLDPNVHQFQLTTGLNLDG